MQNLDVLLTSLFRGAYHCGGRFPTLFTVARDATDLSEWFWIIVQTLAFGEQQNRDFEESTAKLKTTDADAALLQFQIR